MITPYFDSKRRAAHTWGEVYYQPRAGRLIAFPGWLVHSTQPNMAGAGDSAGEDATASRSPRDPTHAESGSPVAGRERTAATGAGRLARIGGRESNGGGGGRPRSGTDQRQLQLPPAAQGRRPGPTRRPTKWCGRTCRRGEDAGGLARRGAAGQYEPASRKVVPGRSPAAAIEATSAGWGACLLRRHDGPDSGMESRAARHAVLGAVGMHAIEIGFQSRPFLQVGDEVVEAIRCSRPGSRTRTPPPARRSAGPGRVPGGPRRPPPRRRPRRPR